MQLRTVELHDESRCPEIEAFLADRIYEFNVNATGYADGRLLAGTIQDDAGEIIAGINGHTWGGCCEIAHVWVHERHRGKGLGSALVHAAESEAVRRGCEQVVLMTHDFQGPEFYEHLGYERKFDIDGRPKGYTNIVYVRRLQGRAGMMRNAILAAMVASTALGQITSYAQVLSTSVPHQAEEQRVLAAEDEYIAAEVTHDEATLRRLVDDRFAFNSSKGTITGKEEFIQSVLRLTMVGQTIRERSVLIEGDLALIFGTAELRLADPGKEVSVQDLRYTSTYVRRQGQWRMLALQMQQRAPK